MKTCSARAVFGLVLVLGGLGGRLPGEGPRAVQVAVLTNETTLAGNIERVGDEYRIVTGSGETAVPAKTVLRVCDSLQKAHEYLRSRANLRDPDERVRLARWCLQNDLIPKAKEETAEALRLKPGHVEAQRLLKRIEAKQAELERGLTESFKTPLSGTDLPDTAGGESKGTARPVDSGNARGPARAPAPKPAGEEYSAETLQAFVRCVQPALLNGCGAGHCHGNVKNGGYELVRPARGGGITAGISRQNLVNTLAILDRDFPDQSLLLRKALERHGGAPRPPLGSRDSAAYAALEAWVKQVAPPKPRELVLGNPEQETKPQPEPPISMPANKPVAGAPDAGKAIQDPQVQRAGFTTSPTNRASPAAGARKPLPAQAKPKQGDVDSPETKNPHGPKPLTGQDRLESFLNRGETLTGPDVKPKPAPQPKPADEFDPLIFNLKKHGVAERP